MRFPIRRDAPALLCSLCGAEQLPGDPVYRINGEVICPDCLPEYACQVFSPYRVTAGEGVRS